jgi:hypothetical protein
MKDQAEFLNSSGRRDSHTAKNIHTNAEKELLSVDSELKVVLSPKLKLLRFLAFKKTQSIQLMFCKLFWSNSLLLKTKRRTTSQILSLQAM